MGFCFVRIITLRSPHSAGYDLISPVQHKSSSALSPSFSSAAAWGPLYIRDLPPTFRNGTVYSARGDTRATALDTAISNFSLRAGFLPPSSALSCMQSAFISSSLHTSLRKPMRLLRESSSVTLTSGRAMAMGSPGKPAPVPTSIRFAPSGISSSGSRLSAKCFLSTSSSPVMAVRFMRLFQSMSIS